MLGRDIGRLFGEAAKNRAEANERMPWWQQALIATAIEATAKPVFSAIGEGIGQAGKNLFLGKHGREFKESAAGRKALSSARLTNDNLRQMNEDRKSLTKDNKTMEEGVFQRQNESLKTWIEGALPGDEHKMTRTNFITAQKGPLEENSRRYTEKFEKLHEEVKLRPTAADIASRLEADEEWYGLGGFSKFLRMIGAGLNPDVTIDDIKKGSTKSIIYGANHQLYDDTDVDNFISGKSGQAVSEFINNKSIRLNEDEFDKILEEAKRDNPNLATLLDNNARQQVEQMAVNAEISDLLADPATPENFKLWHRDQKDFASKSTMFLKYTQSLKEKGPNIESFSQTTFPKREENRKAMDETRTLFAHSLYNRDETYDEREPAEKEVIDAELKKFMTSVAGIEFDAALAQLAEDTDIFPILTKKQFYLIAEEHLRWSLENSEIVGGSARSTSWLPGEDPEYGAVVTGDFVKGVNNLRSYMHKLVADPSSENYDPRAATAADLQVVKDSKNGQDGKNPKYLDPQMNLNGLMTTVAKKINDSTVDISEKRELLDLEMTALYNYNIRKAEENEMDGLDPRMHSAFKALEITLANDLGLPVDRKQPTTIDKLVGENILIPDADKFWANITGTPTKEGPSSEITKGGPSLETIEKMRELLPQFKEGGVFENYSNEDVQSLPLNILTNLETHLNSYGPTIFGEPYRLVKRVLKAKTELDSKINVLTQDQQDKISTLVTSYGLEKKEAYNRVVSDANKRKGKYLGGSVENNSLLSRVTP
jgi:hypothetical protein